MAVAYAKFTGELGVCLSTGGPGATHLITGLYDAKHGPHAGARHLRPGADAPSRGAHYQQELNLDRHVRRRRRLRAGGDDAAAGRASCSTARSAPRWRATRVAAVIMPNDLSGRSPTRRRARARLHALRPRLLAAARRARTRPTCAAPPTCSMPAARSRSSSAPARCGATDEVIAVADQLQAGAAKALLGKAALPDDLPWVTGTSACSAPSPVSDMMDDCDTLLMVGTRLSLVRVPARRQARRARCRSTSTRRCWASATRREVNLHGDSAETLRALLPLLRAEDRHALARRHRRQA